MSDIGAVEFGSWIIDELKREILNSKSLDVYARKLANQRIEQLEVARQLLMEFLKNQHEMLKHGVRQ
jgi:NADPH-dependent 7-cyano-7-deazaguanine reductase QueF-like protein